VADELNTTITCDSEITLTNDEVERLEACRVNSESQLRIAKSESIRRNTILSESASQDEFITVPFSHQYKTDDFTCSRNSRMAGFFDRDVKYLVPSCQCFVALDPVRENCILGYYTISPATARRESASASVENRNETLPMGLIGFLGRDDGAPIGFGAVLLIDAARRASRYGGGIYGLVLRSAGGKSNQRLWSWYLGRGFRECRRSDGVLYAPLSTFIA
jgi:hypothetical protein